MKTKTVEYQDDEFKATIVVRRASLLENLVHEQLVQEALGPPKPAKVKDDPEPEKIPVIDPFAQARRTVSIAVWPTIYSATVAATIEAVDSTDRAVWPFGVETFLGLELPQELIDAWIQAAWELNPSWQSKPPASAEERKAEKKD